MTRFLSVALVLAALAAPLAGCDLTTDQGVFDGPTVQFGSSSLTAPEGETAQIPVLLTGADAGQTVTVDVLFAAAASSACTDDGPAATCALVADDTTIVDFTGFGQPATNSNRVQTVTLTADADGNATVNLPVFVRNEGLVESAQTAVFALQNIPEGVRIGTPREITLVIGTLPLSTIRAFPDGADATVEGIVTRAAGRFTYVQDATGAIAIFSPAGTPLFDAVAAGTVSPGDRIQVAGEVDIFNNLIELSFVTGFQVITPDEGIPAPQVVTLAQLTANLAQYQSELVRVPNITFQTANAVFDTNGSSGINYTITDATGTFTLRFPRAPDSDATGTPIPQGPTTFTGVLGQFGAVGQLTLVSRSDLNP